MQHAVTRDIRRLADGQVVYTAMCNETGGMIDDATVFRLGADNFRFVGGDEYDGVHLQGARRARGHARVDQADHRRAAQPRRPGPAEPRHPARDHLGAPTPSRKLEELRWFRFLIGRIGAYDGIPVVVSRTGYSGELGYEVFCHPSDGAGGVGRDHGGGRAARAQAARARRARHAADRVRADLRRLRVRRPGRPVRGRHRLHGRARRRGGLLRQGGADRAQGAPAAHARRARARGQRDRRATATACTSPARATRSA